MSLLRYINFGRFYVIARVKIVTVYLHSDCAWPAIFSVHPFVGSFVIFMALYRFGCHCKDGKWFSSFPYF